METEKICPKCLVLKNAEDFYPNKHRPDGMSSYCRPCQKLDAQSRYTYTPRWKAPEGMKKCSNCKEILTVDSFGNNKSTHDGLQAYCKPCLVKSVTKSRRKNPESHREANKTYRLKYREYHSDNNARWRYGVELGTYARMLKDQNGVCAICGTPPKEGKRLAIDHCHDTRKVRGLLCGPCNTGIGQLRHSRELLLKAINYLDLHASSEGGSIGTYALNPAEKLDVS